MNALRRLHCRAFQLVFRAALPVLPYRQPKLLGRLRDIAPLLRQKKIPSVLLVADAGVRRLGLTASLEDSLKAAHIAFAVYEQQQANPTVDHVEQARALYLQSGSQAIIAVGGGSAIDCAKVVGARIARPHKTVQKMRGLLRVMRPTPLLIAIPTTAGTGSETTLAAVITDPATHHKYPINDFALIPDYAVLDAGLTLGLPPHITATTGMDALTHAVEAYIGRSTTRLTRTMAEEAVTLIVHHLPAVCEDGSNLKSRQQMLRSAYCAGIAFTRSYVGYAHGIAHSLGGQYGIAHGLANAVILPHMLRRYGLACSSKLAKLAYKSGIVSPDTDETAAAGRFIEWIEEMNQLFGIPKGFCEIREEDIPHMAHHAAQECNPLYPVPLLLDQQELEAMYHQLMHKEETR